MNRFREPLRSLRLGVLALAVLAALPALANAAEMGFKNDLAIPIIVQGQSVVNKVLRRGQPLLINPTKLAWDTNIMPGQRIIIIYDANRTNRILGRFVIPCDGRDFLFSVQLVPVPPGVPPRVQLVPLPLP